jgi:hypothetical protein
MSAVPETQLSILSDGGKQEANTKTCLLGTGAQCSSSCMGCPHTLCLLLHEEVLLTSPQGLGAARTGGGNGGNLWELGSVILLFMLSNFLF